jgi:hypothetical protein
MTHLNKLPVGVEEGIYEYVRGVPIECIGSHYRLICQVLDIPSYQHKLLVEAMDGPDAGLWFTCTVANFKMRYRKVTE